jgi:hypothetical protein
MRTRAESRYRTRIGRRIAGVVLAATCSGLARAELPFDAPWCGFNVGTSAYPGNPEAFERDPTALTTADFDGDGRLDVAVANFEYAAPGGGTNGMSGFAVIFGRPDGRFSEAMHVTVSFNQGCWDIAAADFDNDGDPDIAVSVSTYSWSGTLVRVYLNDGAGAFPTFRTRTVPDGPIGIAAVDFDTDGNVDLAVASYRTFEPNGMVSILRGDGTGALLAPTSYLVGSRPWKLDAGDLDGDGDLDLAVAHELHEVTVLYNAGDATFADIDSYGGFFPNQGGQFYGCITLADADRDDDIDIFYSNTRSGPVLGSMYIVHLRNDDGVFTRAADIPATGATDLISGDVNGDLWPDLIAVEHSGRDEDGPRIIMNDGSGGFLPMTMLPAGQATFAVTLADVDGDEDADLLTADRFSMAVTVHENPGDGHFPTLTHFETAGLSTRLDAGDVDGDGDLDVMVSSESFGTVGALLFNEGGGTFGSPQVYTHSETYGRGVARAKLRDLDGDEDLDLLYNGAHTDFHDGYNFYTAMNDGAGSFGPITQWFIGTCGNGDVDAFDIDEDGDLDVINCEELACAGGSGANRLFISLNAGDGTFAPAYTIQISTGPHALLGGDFDENGHVDLVTTHWMPYGLRDFINVHLGNGDGTFQEERVYQTGQGPRWVVQDDFDGDGHADLATGNSGSDNEGRETLTVLFGTGTTFTNRTDYYMPFSPDLIAATGLASGDVDRDGDVDLMATTTANGVAFYENDGTGSFTFTIRYGLSWDPWSVFYADFDGDDVEDLAFLSNDGLGILHGTGAVTVGVPGTSAASPAAARLSPPTPNPFRTLARFDVQVPTTQRVRVVVYDASGRAVATIHDGDLEGGVRHAFALGGNGLPGGVYFVRAHGDTFDATRKAVLTR